MNEMLPRTPRIRVHAALSSKLVTSVTDAPLFPHPPIMPPNVVQNPPMTA